MIPEEIANTLKAKFPDAILEVKTDGVIDPYAKIAPARIRDVALFMRDDENLAFDYLMCLRGVDYTGGQLGGVYSLSSMKLGRKFTVKAEVDVQSPHVRAVE